MKTETQNLFRVAIVGAASLKGKELKDVLEERNFPAAEIKLLDDDESLGQLERVQDEVAVVQPAPARRGPRAAPRPLHPARAQAGPMTHRHPAA